ncbi:MAG: PQQ-like beta-propeller repeat protein [Verrucomicrobiales bacterium]|nr:PQQ-like beta-propeller repeat protein [Verrucomicrobiales bacterium]
MRVRIAWLICVGLMGWGVSGWAEDWPGYRGRTGMGVTVERGLALDWGVEEVLWKAELPPGVHGGVADHNQSSPVVSGGKVFVTTAHWVEGADRSGGAPEHRVACYAAESGECLWDVEVEPGGWVLNDLRGGYAVPTPAVADGRLFVAFGSSVLHALDFEGARLWSYAIGDFESFDVAFASSPVVFEDTVILLLDRKKPASKLVALDVVTGEVRWEKMRPDCEFGHATPVLAEVGGSVQLLVSATDSLQGVDPRSGEVLWSCRWGRSIWPVASPVVAGGLVYCIGGRGGHPGVVVDPTGSGDVTTSHLKWEVKPMSEGLSSPVVFEGRVYRLNSPGVLRCVDIATGEEYFRERFPGADHRVSPFVTPEGRIYYASAGKTVVVEAGKALKILGESDLGDASAAAAAVSDGRIFLKGARYLWAIGEK